MSASKKISVAIFASGAGSNALNLLRTARSLKNLWIPLVIVDQKSSSLPESIAKEFPEVKVSLIEAPSKIRAEHEKLILSELKEYSIEWCFLAGYMRLLGPILLGAFKSRIVNIHPSLLPKYPGLHAYEQAFAAGDSISGVTIHYVDEGLDTGPIIVQSHFERHEGDRLEDFIRRGKVLEWLLYSNVLTQLNDQGSLAS